LPFGDQPLIGAERLGVRDRIVGPVRQVEIDRLDAEPPQRRLDRLLDIDAARPFLPGPISEPTLVTIVTALRLPRAFSHAPMIVSDSPPTLPGAHFE